MSNLVSAWNKSGALELLENYHDLIISDLSIAWQESLPIRYIDAFFNPSLQFSIFQNNSEFMLSAYFKDAVIASSGLGKKANPYFSTSTEELKNFLKYSRLQYLNKFQSFLAKRKITLLEDHNKQIFSIDAQLEQIGKYL